MLNDATPRQRWAIFCGLKVQCKPEVLRLSKQEASDVISVMKSEGNEAALKLLTHYATTSGQTLTTSGKPKVSEDKWEAIFAEADAAGRAAVESLRVVPMVVVQHENPLDDNSPAVKEYFVEDGACGFAWVKIRPANHPFVKWMHKAGKARDKGAAYNGGYDYWISDYNQSIQKKEAYAYAFADVLQKHGIKAYADSRLD